jgi:transcriptional regulator with XRE-family HTH domain
MTPSEFKSWRKAMGLRQKEAATRLGLKKRVIQYYERGHRDGRKVAVPKTVELACFALAAGVVAYDGGKVKRRR